MIPKLTCSTQMRNAFFGNEKHQNSKITLPTTQNISLHLLQQNMTTESNEELRSLLRYAEQGKRSTEFKIQDRQVSELASLIGAIEGTEISSSDKPVSYRERYNISSKSYTSQKPEASYEQYRESKSKYTLPDQTPYRDDMSDTITISETQSRSINDTVDTLDYTVVHFNNSYSIRGKHGKYLTAICEEQTSENHPPSQLENSTMSMGSKVNPSKGPNAQQTNKVYLLNANGQGIGELNDSIQFVSVDNRENNGPIKYGQVIAIKSPFSKERLLGLRDGNKLGFWRHVIGQGEKWQVIKANINVVPSIGALGSSSNYIGTEDVSARGKYVRIGDPILIQTYKSDHFISTHEVVNLSSINNPSIPSSFGGNGINNTHEIRLIYRDKTGVGSELWQLEVFGTVPLPAWYQNRPYLSGKYLVMSPAMRAPAPEVEARVFPRSVLPPGVSATSSTASLLTGNTPTTALFNPLTNYPVADQQTILMRELLLILSGIEGHYIRVAAVPSSNPVPPGTVPMTTSGLTGTPPPALTINPHQHLPKLPEIKLVIDMDNADRSTASQVNQLLIICEYVIKIRAFITQQTRYEYGYISHALCAGMKEILSEFHILLCQLEYLLNISKLTLQKMIFLLQSSKIVLQILEKLCYSVKELIGGELLNVMYQLYLEQGDMKAKEIYGYLLTKAFQPFLNMLSLWIFRGELHDPYHEFMIAEDITISKESLQEDFNAQYWDTRYTLAAKHIPKILSMMSSSSLSSTATTSTSTTQSFAQKILITGKYLNVVRDCLHTMGAIASAGRKEDDGVHHAGMEGGKSRHHRYELPESVPLTLDFLLPQGMIGSKSTTNPSSFFTNPTAIASAATTSAVPPATSTVITASHSREYTTLFTHINRAYSTASALLLQLLQQEYSLSSHFVSLHHFFLLEHGDFFIQFMDIAEEELSKDVQDISLLHLQQLLMLSVQTSTLSNDEHKEDLFCSLASHNLIQHLHLIQMAGESSSSEFYSNMKNQQNNGSSTSLSSSSSTSNRLKGMEAFTLDYHVGWPLSIVLSRRVITKYQLLSRLLYFSKHVERRLLTTWMSHQTCKELLALAHRYTRRSSTRGGGGGSDADDSSNQLPAEQRSFITNVQQLFALRHRMLHFIQNFVYYITLEVIYPHHHEFFAHLHGTTTEYTNLPSMMHDEGGGEEEGEEGEEDGARGSMSGGDGMGTAGGGNGGKGTINIQDMDAILEIHEKFLDICLKECLLASQDLLKILMKLMTTCLLFTDHMIKFMADIQSLIHQTTPSTGGGRSGAGGGRGYQEEENVFTVPAAGAASSSSAASSPNKDSQISKKAKKFQQFYNSRQEKMQEYTYLLQQEIQQEAFQRILQKFMLTFDSQLKEFLTNLWTNSYRHHVQLANLCVRLDYNGYYTQHFTPSMSSSGGGGGGGGGGGSSYSTL